MVKKGFFVVFLKHLQKFSAVSQRIGYSNTCIYWNLCICISLLRIGHCQSILYNNSWWFRIRSKIIYLFIRFPLHHLVEWARVGNGRPYSIHDRKGSNLWCMVSKRTVDHSRCPGTRTRASRAEKKSLFHLRWFIFSKRLPYLYTLPLPPKTPQSKSPQWQITWFSIAIKRSTKLERMATEHENARMCELT